jgi:poly(hydroxyalkanoate) depolymerase family esterase
MLRPRGLLIATLIPGDDLMRCNKNLKKYAVDHINILLHCSNSPDNRPLCMRFGAMKDCAVVKLRIEKTIGRFLAQRRTWERLMQAAGRMRSAIPQSGDARSSHLRETQNFGSNPGALRMFSHLPPQVTDGCALLVILHGCTQNAAGYDLGAGWSTLADRFGFALLLPEQQRSNNPNGCFNWFQPGDIERGRGEALSIRQMVGRMVSDHKIDPKRVFITGLSAGGAMTSVMLATYPDVFAGGAIVAGLPYGAASNVQEAFENMFQCPPRSAPTWGDLVRNASHHDGPWPCVSVWHGGADATVIPSNANEIIKQWTNVHGVRAAPSIEATVDGYPRQVWIDDAGIELIESFTIPHMAHGTPLATGGEAAENCGAAGPFLLEVGISSSYHIAKFFGLTAGGRDNAASAKRATVTATPAIPFVSDLEPSIARPDVLEGEILDHDDPAGPSGAPASPTLPIDIGSVITKALKAAGLLK